jgi:hypothetical protein
MYADTAFTFAPGMSPPLVPSVAKPRRSTEVSGRRRRKRRIERAIGGADKVPRNVPLMRECGTRGGSYIAARPQQRTPAPPLSRIAARAPAPSHPRSVAVLSTPHAAILVHLWADSADGIQRRDSATPSPSPGREVGGNWRKIPARWVRGHRRGYERTATDCETRGETVQESIGGVGGTRMDSIAR